MACNVAAMRIAVLADCHIDHGAHGHWADPAWRAATTEIAKNGFDAAVVAGDLFHTGRPSAEAMLRCAEGLRNMASAGVRVVLIAGNHEWAGVRAVDRHRPPLLMFEEIDGVTALMEPQSCRVGDAWIGCLPWPAPGAHEAGMTQAQEALLLADEAERILDGPTLLVAHAAVGEALPHPGSEIEIAPAAATSSLTAHLADLDLEPFDRIALGHVHSRLALTETCGYVGSLEAFTFIDEGRVGGFSEFRHGGGGEGWEEVWHPAGQRRFATVGIGEDLSTLKEGTIVRVLIADGQSPADMSQQTIEDAGLVFAGWKDDRPVGDDTDACESMGLPEAGMLDHGELLSEWAQRERLTDDETALLAAEARDAVGWEIRPRAEPPEPAAAAASSD